jgi:hypothetical protein
VSSVEAVGRTGQDGAMRARDIAVSLPTVTVRDPVLKAVQVILQTTVYCGVPAANHAFAVAILRDGHEHRGIDPCFGGVSHRIDFQGLVGASTWLSPQTA